MESARSATDLPTPATEVPVPAGEVPDVPGLSSFITPNADFYRIDTSLLVPQVETEGWTMRITGMVDHPYELTYEQL